MTPWRPEDIIMNAIDGNSVTALFRFVGRVLIFFAFQAREADSRLSQILIVITTLIGSLAGVVTAVGSIYISMARIRSDNERMKLVRDDQVRSLQEELRLLYIQVSGTPEGVRLVEQIKRLQSYREDPGHTGSSLFQVEFRDEETRTDFSPDSE